MFVMEIFDWRVDISDKVIYMFNFNEEGLIDSTFINLIQRQRDKELITFDEINENWLMNSIYFIR